MAIRAIQEIKINPPISFGQIYNFNLDLSSDGASPASLTLNIINETGEYPIENLSFGYLNPYKITIFNKFEIYMYLTGYTESRSARQKSLVLEFQDGSHILDRVQVVLMDLHVSSTLPNGTIKPSIAQYQSVFTQKVLCDSCDLSFTKYIVQKSDIKILKSSIGFPAFNPVTGRSYGMTIPAVQGENVVGNNQQGGFILVGTEKFTKTQCEVPQIIYNFTDLKIAANRIGIDINIPDTFPGYTSQSSDSLRSVLADFCGKFGFSPWYNFYKLKPTIEYNDLKNNKTYLSLVALKHKFKNFKSTSITEPIITSIEDSENKKGTTRQYASLSARVNNEFKTSSVRDINYRTFFKAIKLHDLFNKEALGGRTEGQALISSYLSVACPVARTLYNLSLRGKGLSDEDSLNLCGYQMLYKFPEEEKANFLRGTQDIRDEKWKKSLQAIGAKDPITGKENHQTYDLYIGNYFKEFENVWSDWEKKVFDFVGKYFWNSVGASPENKMCDDPYASISVMATLDPKGEEIFKTKKAGECNKSFHFKDMLNSPAFKKTSHSENIFENFENRDFVRIFSRSDGAYSLSPALLGQLLSTRFLSVGSIDYDCEKIIDGKVDKKLPSPLDNFKPSWLPVSANRVAILYNNIKGNPSLLNSTFGEVLAKIMTKHPDVKDISLHLAMVPSTKTINKVFSVSKMYEAINTDDNKRISSRQQLDCPPNACAQESEVNSNPFSSNNPCACIAPSYVNPDTVSSPSPKKYIPGPANFLTVESLLSGQHKFPAFLVTLKKVHGALSGRSFEVVFPFGSKTNSDEWWQGNYNEKITKHQFHPGFSKVLNDFSAPGDVSDIKIVHEDVSSHVLRDLSSQFTYPSLIPLDLQSYNSGGFVTFAEYFSYLKTVFATGSNYPRKSLTITCAGSEFGSLLEYMQFEYGFKAIKISQDSAEGVKYTLTFESRTVDVPNMFLTFFKEKMALEKGQKGS